MAVGPWRSAKMAAQYMRLHEVLAMAPNSLSDPNTEVPENERVSPELYREFDQLAGCVQAFPTRG
jgi:hypothetical protein